LIAAGMDAEDTELTESITPYKCGENGYGENKN
jgi:hypothetical protein